MSLKGSRRVRESTVKNWMIKHWPKTVPFGALAIVLIGFLIATGAIVLTGYSGDMNCTGVNPQISKDPLDNLCLARVSFIAKTDVFIYPGQEWGLSTDKPIKNLRLFRTWGKGASIDTVSNGITKGLREIKLNETCKGTWCGGKRGVTTNAYSYALRTGRPYTFYYVAEKYTPTDIIKWSFGIEQPYKLGEYVDPAWLPGQKKENETEPVIPVPKNESKNKSKEELPYIPPFPIFPQPSEDELPIVPKDYNGGGGGGSTPPITPPPIPDPEDLLFMFGENWVLVETLDENKVKIKDYDFVTLSSNGSVKEKKKPSTVNLANLGKKEKYKWAAEFATKKDEVTYRITASQNLYKYKNGFAFLNGVEFKESYGGYNDNDWVWIDYAEMVSKPVNVNASFNWTRINNTVFNLYTEGVIDHDPTISRVYTSDPGGLYGDTEWDSGEERVQTIKDAVFIGKFDINYSGTTYFDDSTYKNDGSWTTYHTDVPDDGHAAWQSNAACGNGLKMVDTDINYISVDNSGGEFSFGTSQDFSVVFWIKSTGDGGARLISTSQTAPLSGWTVDLTTLKPRFFGRGAGAVDYLATSDVAITNDTWAHVVVNVNRTGNSTFFINGSSVAFTVGAGNNASGLAADFDSAENFEIGKIPIVETNMFTGEFASIKVFNRTITQSEIDNMYGNESICQADTVIEASTDLVLYLPLNDSETSIADDFSTPDNDGTLFNYSRPEQEAAYFNLGLFCDGNDDKISLTVAGARSDTITVCSWFSIEDNTIDNMSLVSSGDTSAFGSTNFNLQIDLDEFRFDGDTTNLSTSGAGIGLDTPTHVCAKNNGTHSFIYMDGVELINASHTVNNANAAGEFICGNDWGVDERAFFAGVIDDTIIWNRSLTATEINTVYTSPDYYVPRYKLEGNYTGDFMLLGYKGILSEFVINGLFGNDSTTPYRTATDPNLIAWFPLDGDANEINGASIGNVYGAQFGVLGINDSPYFDGTNDYIDVGAISLHNNFTVSLWIRPDLYDFGESLSTSAGNRFTLATYADGQIIYYIGNGTWGNSVLAPAGTIADRDWSYVTATYNSTHTELLVNGVSHGVASNIGYSVNETFFIGMRTNTVYPFNGWIDEVKFYNRTLNTTEIKEDYKLARGSDLDVEIRSCSDYGTTCSSWTIHDVDDMANGVFTADSALFANAIIAYRLFHTSYENEFTVFSKNITFSYGDNSVPTHTTPIINSSAGLNNSNENLTVYNQSFADGNNDSLYSVNTWYLNGSSIMAINMPFDGNNGSYATEAIDYSGNSNDLTVSGASWNISKGYDGRGAYDFNGSNVIYKNGIGLSATSSKTMVAWLNVNNFYATPQIAVLWGTGSHPKSLSMNLDTVDSIGCSAWDGITALKSVIPTDTWFHLACVFNGSHIIQYLNGSLVGSRAKVIDSTGQDWFSVGARKDTGSTSNYFNGTIDEVMVYDRAVSPEQVLALYNNRTDLLVSQETNPGENWSACVIPNDNWEEGSELCTVNLTINSVPSCTVVNVTPSDLLDNSTGVFTAIVNCTDSDDNLNASSMFITLSLDESPYGLPNNWSLRPPDNNLSDLNSYGERILRADNRNQGLFFENLGLFADNYSYAVHSNASVRTTITTGVGFVTLNYTWNVEPTVYESMVFLDREALENENKIGQEHEIFKKNGLLVKLLIPHLVNNFTITTLENINYTGNPNLDLKKYYCNDSYNISASITPLASSNCVFFDTMSKTDLDAAREYTSGNSTYVENVFSVINGQFAGITVTRSNYIFYISDVPSGLGKYIIRYANGSAGINLNVTFATTNVALSSTDGGKNYVQESFTPDITLSEEPEIDHRFSLGVYINDLSGDNFTNFNLYTDVLGDANFSISGVGIESYYWGYKLFGNESDKDSDKNGTHYNGMTAHINIAINPNGVGTVNHTLYLTNTDGSINYTINNSFYSADDGDLHILFNTTLVPDGVYKMNITAVADDNPNDIQSILTFANFTINNTPTINDSQLLPATIYTNTTANCSGFYEDYANDTGTVWVQWYLNQTVNESGSFVVDDGDFFNFTLDDSFFTKNANITCELWVGDSLANSSRINITKTVANSVPYNTSVQFLPTTLHTNETANCSGNYNDADADAGTVWVQWYLNQTINETENAGVANGSFFNFTLLNTFFTKNSNVTCEVWVGDGTANSTKSNLTKTVNNTAPAMTNTQLLPSVAYTNSTMNCSAIYVDPDVDAGTVYYTFYVNDTVNETGSLSSISNGSLINFTLGSSNFAKSWNVTCELTPNDGTVNGTSINSSTIVISNLVPSVESIIISPSIAYTNTTLIGSGVANDGDADLMTVYFEWFKNGVSILNQNNASVTTGTNISNSLASSNFVKGDLIILQVWAGDGTINSSKVNSSTLTISNLVPELSNLNLTPNIIYSNTTANCSGIYLDEDDDAGNAFFQWYVNDTINESGSIAVSGNNSFFNTTLASSNYFGGWNITCEVWVGDTELNSSKNNISKNITDYPTVPSNPWFNLEFIMPWNASDLIVYSLGFETNASGSPTAQTALSTVKSVNSSVGGRVAPQVVGQIDPDSPTVRWYFGNIPSLPIIFERNYSVMFMINDSTALADGLVSIPINVSEAMEAYSFNWTVTEEFNTNSLLLTAGTIYGGILNYSSTTYKIPFYVMGYTG